MMKVRTLVLYKVEGKVCRVGAYRMYILLPKAGEPANVQDDYLPRDCSTAHFVCVMHFLKIPIRQTWELYKPNVAIMADL